MYPLCIMNVVPLLSIVTCYLQPTQCGFLYEGEVHSRGRGAFTPFCASSACPTSRGMALKYMLIYLYLYARMAHNSQERFLLRSLICKETEIYIIICHHKLNLFYLIFLEVSGMKHADRLKDKAFPRLVRPRLFVARVPSPLPISDTYSGHEGICDGQWNTQNHWILKLSIL
jgi:hypothetical protein